MSLRVGLVGATGLVGQVFMQLMEERNFPLTELKPFASEASRGKKISCQNKEWEVQTLSPRCFENLDVVFFSSGDDISSEWAPHAAACGAFAIDNSAAFRLNSEFLLVVPEVNGHLLPAKTQPQVIANPNCSTIQLVVLLRALNQITSIEQVVVSSYQSVSGAGAAGRQELIDQTQADLNNLESPKSESFPHSIAFNVLPQIGSFNNLGFCSEEMKIMEESRKILDLPDLKISAFTVRVPTLSSHGEAVWVEFDQELKKQQILNSLEQQSGLEIIDDVSKQSYPLPKSAAGTDPVYVGRIHQDLYDPKRWIFWVVADNLRKGAALNGLQIAEQLFGIA